MASFRKRHPANVPGVFFVDRTCIDCGACEWLAPETFADLNGLSRVTRQPANEKEHLRAIISLLSCPVGAIGSRSTQDFSLAVKNLPEQIDDDVLYCGYHSSKSYGAASYLIVRPQGNILVDSPRFAKPLVKRIEELGGIAWMFLTHKDDVAEHERFHRHFGCRRILHEADLTEDTCNVEILLKGDALQSPLPDVRIVPVSGHTAGSCCLLWKDTFLFTGDHLSWDPKKQALTAARATCWYDWSEQIRSMKRLSGLRFEWVLPGHGVRCHLPSFHMAQEMEKLTDHMASL
ncbi:MAG: MBL fold metallo-hydrolase [Nitrospirae bacterium]|jgi:glyoxylase-like metal-dependent hydrolase (beta-lactamase superfamily II)/ferredoxin|nr:MBL fold metallo-hydrolase [Nitrospirota bacterium]